MSNVLKMVFMVYLSSERFVSLFIFTNEFFSHIQLDARKKQQKFYQKQNDSLRRGFNSLEKNANSTEDIMQVAMKKLHVQLNATTIELEAAKEEIAVKVAQVKQYQKQVEAYKQQLEQVCDGYENKVASCKFEISGGFVTQLLSHASKSCHQFYTIDPYNICIALLCNTPSFNYMYLGLYL